MADPTKTVPMTTSAPSKSEKYNQATARAVNRTVDTGKSSEPIGDVGAMISKFDVSDLNEMAKTGKYEFAPQNVELKPGEKIEGILEGYGSGNDFINESTGEVRHVDSWIIKSPDGTLRASILSSTQLDTKLPPFISLPVIIARRDDIKLAGGHKCADYHVGGPRLTEGTRRWGKTREEMYPTPVALPAAPDQAALPAAGETAMANGATGNHATA